MFWMTTLWGQILVFIRRFVVYVKYHFHRYCKHPDVSSGCFMSAFYSGVNIVGMVKEAMEVFFESVHFMSMSSMKRDQENGFWGEDCIICFSSFPMKILAYEGAIVVPIAVLLICIICSPLNVKLLCFSINVSNWTRPSVGDSLTALWSQASQHRHYVGC